MLVALPLSAFALLTLLHGRRRASGDGGGDWRDSFLFACVAWGLLNVFLTETASVSGLLRRAPVAVGWGILCLLLGLAAGRAGRGRSPGRGGSRPMETTGAGKAPTVLLAGSAAILALVALTAWFAAPNTWDALTYHLPRASHWIQNGTVAHYPTAILRQLDLPPWSEFAIAQLALLSGGDRLANFVQCFALASAAIAASLVARELSAPPRGQMLAAVAALTAPMAILQGSSTQNDLVEGAWMLCLVFFLLRASASPRAVGPVAGGAAALGLALATKATGLLFAAPFALWLVLILVLRLAPLAAFTRILLFLLGALAVNAGHLARNVSTFGSLLSGSYGAVNETFGPRALFSGALRNAAVQLATPSPSVNRSIERGVAGIHRLLGLDPDDPRTTWHGARFRVAGASSGTDDPDQEETLFRLFHEDTASNPIHVVLAAAAAAVALLGGSARRHRVLSIYSLALGTAFLLFSLVLKWQPWHSRLELPLLLLGAPLVGAALLAPGSRRATEWIGLLLLLCAFPWALGNATRPLLGEASVLSVPREEQFFANRPDLRDPYRRAAAVAVGGNCRSVGVVLGPDDGEHLFWVAAGAVPGGPIRLEHVAVENRSAPLARERRFPFAPCAILSTRDPGPASPGPAAFREAWPGGEILVFRASGLAPPPGPPGR